MKSSKENISPTSLDYFRQLYSSKHYSEKTNKSISEELFSHQVTHFSSSSKQSLKNDLHNIFDLLNIKQSSLMLNGSNTLNKKFRRSPKRPGKPFFNSIVEKLKKASSKISRYSLKRKSFLLTNQDQSITQQNAWINILNDDYSNSKIKKNKINQSFFYYYSYYYKIINNFIIFISFLSIILAVVNNELYICKSNNYLLNLYPSEKDNIYYYNSDFFNLDNFRKLTERKISVVENIFIIINIIISIILSVLLWIHAHFKIKIKLYKKKISEYDSIFTLNFFPKYLIETLIALICIPPTINKVYTGSIGENDFIYTVPGIFLIFSFLKVLLIIDNSNNLTRYNNKVAKSILRNNKTQPGLRYAIKCLYKSKPILTMIILFSFTVLVLIEVIRAFELGSFSRNQKLLGKKGVNDLRNYINCFWLVLTTVLSVGFGDVSPRSPIGRIAIIVARFLGNIFLSLFIISFSTFIEFTSGQRKAFAKLSKIFDKDNTENKAANVVKYLLLIQKYLKKEKKGKTEKFGLLSLLITHINKYKNKYIIASSYAMPVTNVLSWIEKSQKNHWNELSELVLNFSNIECDLLELITINKQNLDSIKVILERQSSINSFLTKRMRVLYEEGIIKKKRISNKGLFEINLERYSGVISFGSGCRHSRLSKQTKELLKFDSVVSSQKKRNFNLNYLNNNNSPVRVSTKKYNSGRIRQFFIVQNGKNSKSKFNICGFNK